MSSVQARKLKTDRKKIKPGPVRSPDGIPYDYIVIIDAGSHGSRAYIYNWLNPKHALDSNIDLGKTHRLNLVRRVSGKETSKTNTESDTHPETDSDSDSDNEENQVKARFPSIYTHKKWHRKIKPGLSSFNEFPQKVGKHHLSSLLNLASSVVPKSEHHRTPIFLHATAGMRILPPDEQEPILENVCQYLVSNSDFFIPDCKSHVNIIDGNIEGLYGWLSINYLVRSFDKPEEHQHGKNHTTYGLLDMGGASTQVVFQPNQTEVEEHKNNLYKFSLYTLPELLDTTDPLPAERAQYLDPQIAESNVYSDSFLGFGMFQAHNRYLKVLLEDFRKANDFSDDVFRFRTPIPDPCLPKGYTFTGLIDENPVEFTGKSDFNECLNSIFPVLANNTYTQGKSEFSGHCQQLGEESKVSSCLLNDLIPSFDFDVNHFIGVSGYWDIVNSLLASPSLHDEESQSEKYDYSLIYKKTQQICTSPLNDLLSMNDLREKSSKITEEDLAELCFKASWILNFLHVGLGFPRFGIDEVPNKDEKFKSLELIEKVGGSSFSWTLGRAILYANDEYTQAYNNYTRRFDPESALLARPGFVFTAAEESFVYGAESSNVLNRPLFTESLSDTKFPQYDYETNYQEISELKWSLQPHHLVGLFIFILVIVLVTSLLIGRSGRSFLREKVGRKFQWLKNRALSRTRGGSQYDMLGSTEPIEMSLMQARKQQKDDDVFQIEDDIE